MDESSFVMEVIIPSLMKATQKMRVATIGERTKHKMEDDGFEMVMVCDPEPSVDINGAPGVLLFFEDGTLQISVTPISEEGDLFLYRVAEQGYEDWTFPAAMLPEDMECFPLLKLLYDRIRFEKGERSDMARLYEDTRLPALREALADLSMNTAETVVEGRRVAVAMEEGEPIRFYYNHTIPELELTMLTVEFDDRFFWLPEFGEVPEKEYYSRVLSAL